MAKRIILHRIMVTAQCAAACLMLTSCFTGVEGTKKIELNRHEEKQSQPTQEDLYISDIQPLPASSWEVGKEFLVIDDRASMIFDKRNIPGNTSDMHLQGHVMRFKEIRESATPAGETQYLLAFNDGTRDYVYPTGITKESGRTLPQSDEIPMMVDKSLVDNLDLRLRGKTLWTRTPLWNDTTGESIKGRKYVAVHVDSISAGERVYPVRVNFTADDGTKAYVYLTFGIAGIDSRSFSSQFSMTDIHKEYPKIDDNIWKLIQNGDVAEGMTKDECRLSLGNPYDVGSGHNTGYVYDVWQYADGVTLLFQDGILQRYQK